MGSAVVLLENAAVHFPLEFLDILCQDLRLYYSANVNNLMLYTKYNSFDEVPTSACALSSTLS